MGFFHCCYSHWRRQFGWSKIFSATIWPATCQCVEKPKTGPISIEFPAGISMDFHLIFWSPRKSSVLGIKGSVSTNSGYSITSSNHLSTDMSISRETNRGKPCLNAIQCFKIVLLHMSKVAAMVESLSGKGPKIYWANCNTEAQVVSFGHTSILCKPTACRRWSTCICKKTW